MTPSRPADGDRPGWYPDPAGRFDERYRLRGRWTARVRRGDAEAIDPTGLDPGAAEVVDDTTGAATEAAGWRTDPAGRFEQRWWDGQRWTRRVRVGDAVATDAGRAPTTRRGGRRATRSGRAPGWYPDPEGTGERFWDGHAWTVTHRDASVRGGRPTLAGWMPRSVVRALVVLLVLVVVVVVVLVVVLAG